ncbi:MAG TPA: hypothetical protein VK436_10105 [Methanocella sp.]|nr:hypothetical protein [Methanocella sp.]
MYLPPETVDKLLAFMVKNSTRDSATVFDYLPQSVMNGTCEEHGRNMRKNVTDAGEPLRFTSEKEHWNNSSERSFTKIKNATSEDYRKLYFHGKNEGKLLNPPLLFAYAEVA